MTTFSDYRQSEQHAAAALDEAGDLLQQRLEPQVLAGKVRALHAVAMARKMQLGPLVALPEARFQPRISWPERLRLGFTYLVFGLRIRQLLRGLDRRAPALDPWRLLAWNRYFDHWLVLHALISQLPGARWFVARRLRRLARTALDLGAGNADPHVLAHVQKQLQGLGQDLPADLELAVAAYELLGDPLNRALVHRNRATTLQRAGRIEEAKREYEAMLALALECGSNATALKALVGLRALGAPIDRDVALSVSAGVTGKGYEELAAAFQRALGLALNGGAAG